MTHEQTFRKVKSVFFTERARMELAGKEVIYRQIELETEGDKFLIWLYADERGNLVIQDAEKEKELAEMAKDIIDGRE